MNFHPKRKTSLFNGWIIQIVPKFVSDPYEKMDIFQIVVAITESKTNHYIFDQNTFWERSKSQCSYPTEYENAKYNLISFTQIINKMMISDAQR